LLIKFSPPTRAEWLVWILLHLRVTDRNIEQALIESAAGE